MVPVPPPRRRTAAAACCTGRLPVVPRRPLKKRATAGARLVVREEEDDGLHLSDEVLLHIISRVAGDAADLVRCAATCRRWRRLVSKDAAFLCRHHAPPPRRPDSVFIRLVHLNRAYTASGKAPWFLRPCHPALGGLVDGNGLWASDDASSCRVVASRGGRLVVEIRRARTGRALDLCVCNPVTGEADVLPSLAGNGGDSPWPYACALLKVRRSALSYRVLVIYNRRCFSSDTGSWGPEASVVGARVAGTRLHGTSAAIVHRGVVFWPRLMFALLTLPTASNAVVRGMSTPFRFSRRTRQLGLMPDGRLCLVEAPGGDASRICVRVRSHAGDMFCVRDGTLNGHWGPGRAVHLTRIVPGFSAATSETLRGFCEASSTVFFTARIGHGKDVEECCCTLNLDTHKVREVGSTGGELSGDMYWYEMDWVAYLGTL